MSQPNLKVIGYTRVSTDDQAEKGFSLIDQPAKIRAYADHRGLDLVEVIEDAGECSKTLDRPGLQRVLAMLRAREAGGVVVAYLDRLSRHLGDMVTLVESYFLEADGFRLHSAAETVETRTASGRTMVYFMALMSQYQRELIVEKTAGAMAGKRSRSERTGNLKFGFTTDPSDVRRSRKGNPLALIPCPEDQAIEVTIRQLRGEGRSLRAIADELNAREIPGKRGVTRRSTGRWSKTSVGEILKRDNPDG